MSIDSTRATLVGRLPLLPLGRTHDTAGVGEGDDFRGGSSGVGEGDDLRGGSSGVGEGTDSRGGTSDLGCSDLRGGSPRFVESIVVVVRIGRVRWIRR